MSNDKDDDHDNDHDHDNDNKNENKNKNKNKNRNENTDDTYTKHYRRPKLKASEQTTCSTCQPIHLATVSPS